MADNNTPIGSMFGIFNKLSAQQKMLMGAIVIVTFVLIGFIMYLFNQTTYTPLFSNLAPDQEEACRLYPGFEGISQDIMLFSLHGADGTPIVLTDNRDAAIADAVENDLEAVNVH